VFPHDAEIAGEVSLEVCESFALRSRIRVGVADLTTQLKDHVSTGRVAGSQEGLGQKAAHAEREHALERILSFDPAQPLPRKVVVEIAQ
jgi:hypothetical protein